MTRIHNLTQWFCKIDSQLIAQLRCSVCGSKSGKSFGNPSVSELQYVLSCPKCHKLMAEFDTPAELAIHLSATLAGMPEFT